MSCITAHCSLEKISLLLLRQALGKKAGRALVQVKAELTAMTPADIAAFERDGGAEVAGVCLTTSDVRVSC